MVKWYEVIDPHDDIKSGDFDESVFAADLGNVALGTAPQDYNDPYLFFKKTFFTQGIVNLLRKVTSKLKEGKGSSVIEIKTPFGGGKTHALISIYHYLNNSKILQDYIPLEIGDINAKKAVIVGTHLNPLEGNMREDIKIKTIWGNLAYQLNGREGYLEFEKNDTERISPGKEKLEQFLEKHQPFILLFDEILQYIVRANGVSYSNTNLGSQTFAFFQELTETVGLLDKAIMIVTLPSSTLEDYSPQGEESLARLGKIFMRLESIETPVEGEEVYSVITKRLFGEELQPSLKKDIVQKYFSKYQRHRDELPSKIKDINYRKKMELAYPFHPEVIDILYERWGTFSSFQRTRGVLRMLANVVEDLYKCEKNVDLILPSDINLEATPVRQEFLAHIGNVYESIIGADIAGHNAKSKQMDNENKSWNHLAERLATAIFFYSFSIRPEKGLNLSTAKLACLHEDTISTMVTEVLHQIEESLWYLNEKNNVYFFSKIPNLNRMILDKKVAYEDDFLLEMEKIITKDVGKGFSTIMWPNQSEDIPDTKELKLIVINPQTAKKEIEQWIEKRGTTFRTFKNTLLFAIPDPTGFGFLKDQILTYLALMDIKNDIESGEEESLKDKFQEVKDRIKQIQNDFSYNVRRLYNSILIGKTEFSLGQPKIGKESLSNWFKLELISREKIVKNFHYRYLVNRFLAGKETLSTKLVMEQFYKDPELFIPESENVLKKAFQQAILDGAFALGFKKDGAIEEGSFKFKTNVSLGAISFDDEELMISKEHAVILDEKFKEAKRREEEEKKDEKEEEEDEEEEKEEEDEEEEEEKKKGPKKYKKIHLRIEEIPTGEITAINSGVLMPLIRESGGFNITLEINIESKDGILASTIQNKVFETINQIGANIKQKELKEL